jgi:hypothetical protein
VTAAVSRDPDNQVIAFGQPTSSSRLLLATRPVLVGPIVCASLMRKSIWYPIWPGLALQIFSAVGAFALPETLARSETSQTDQEQPPVTPSQHDPSPIASLPFTKTTNKIYAELVASVNDLVIIFADWKMGMMVGLYPVRMMCMALLDLLPRYISYRYHW